MLTQEKLKSFLEYQPTTGIFTWVKDTGKIKKGDVAGSWSHYGYRDIRIEGVLYKAHRLAFLYMEGRWPSNFIDHKDENKANNSWDNLREATKGQNQCNIGTGKRNSTGAKGIYLCNRKSSPYYEASVVKEGKRTRKMFSLSNYNSKEAALQEAVLWVTKQRLLLHGEFSNHA